MYLKYTKVLKQTCSDEKVAILCMYSVVTLVLKLHLKIIVLLVVFKDCTLEACNTFYLPFKSLCKESCHIMTHLINSPNPDICLVCLTWQILDTYNPIMPSGEGGSMAHLPAWGVIYPRIPARLSAAPHPSLWNVYEGSAAWKRERARLSRSKTSVSHRQTGGGFRRGLCCCILPRRGYSISVAVTKATDKNKSRSHHQSERGSHHYACYLTIKEPQQAVHVFS